MRPLTEGLLVRGVGVAQAVVELEAVALAQRVRCSEIALAALWYLVPALAIVCNGPTTRVPQVEALL